MFAPLKSLGSVINYLFIVSQVFLGYLFFSWRNCKRRSPFTEVGSVLLCLGCLNGSFSPLFLKIFYPYHIQKFPYFHA